MKYGLFVYEESNNKLINIGDYVQSIAAKQYLPKVNEFIERDHLNLYQGDEIKLIMNGWFTHIPENWPPSNKIIPLFVSFHLNNTVAEYLMSSPKIVSYFKKNAPIGCRDNDSVLRMKRAGIDAYYSGCLTTTLNHDGKLIKKNLKKSNKILLIDILFKEDIKFRIKRNYLYFFREVLNGKILDLNKVSNYIKSLVPEENKHEIEVLTCYYDANTTHDQRFEHAHNLLEQLASAKVVVTSRIHIALPCLALGTPVLFVLGSKLARKDEFERLDGVVKFMNILIEDDFDTSRIHLKGLNFL